MSCCKGHSVPARILPIPNVVEHRREENSVKDIFRLHSILESFKFVPGTCGEVSRKHVACQLHILTSNAQFVVETTEATQYAQPNL